MSATDLQHQLHLLHIERFLAGEIGLTERCDRYRADLEREMAECQAAYVGAAVTEIAVIRGELSGRRYG
jgi:hypothetical protein